MQKEVALMPYKKKTLELFTVEPNSDTNVYLLETKVHAGFLTPVDEAYIDQPIDLNKELVSHPATTFFARVIGDSMINEGIEEGDLLVIDRSIKPNEHHLTVCCVNGEFALKRIRQNDNRLILLSGNEKYKPIEITGNTDFQVWGVVTWVMKKKI